MNQAGDRLHAHVRTSRPVAPPVSTDRGRSLLLLLQALTDLLVVDTQHGQGLEL